MLYAIPCNLSKKDRADLDNILVLSLIPTDILGTINLAEFLIPLVQELKLLVWVRNT